MVNFDSKKYWENRYLTNGNSGAGSYGTEAMFKANYINGVIKKYGINSISDFGCGDGNQISLLTGFKKYYGYDFSRTTIDNCIKKLTDKRYQFEYNIEDIPISDITISLDVTYHILEDDYFEEYMNSLFMKSNKYVLIYSMNRNDATSQNMSIHLKNREFVGWVSNNYPHFELVETIKFPEKTNDIGFYLFIKNG